MRVKIKIVLREDWGQEVVRENWITIQLPSGRELEIFDSNAFELEQFEGQTAEMLLFLGYYDIIDLDTINKNDKERIYTGKYLNDFQLPDKWEQYGNWKRKEALEYYKTHHDVFRTSEGIFYLSQYKIKEKPLKIGEELTLKFGRVDLLSWYLIEE